MTARVRTHEDIEGDLRQEITVLRARLEEAEAVIGAIRSGSADAITMETPAGVSVFTLQGSEHPYRVMVETMSEGAVTVSREGLILYCNERFADMLGADLQTVTGSSFPAHFVAHDTGIVLAAFGSPGTAGRRFKASLQRADETLVPVSVAMQRLPEDSSAATVVVLTDLTEVVAAHEERLRRERDLQEQVISLNKDLEARVLQRTAALAAVNEELEAFSYSVSHDLRTPLRAIDGFSAILLQDHSGSLDEHGQHALHRVRESTKRMSDLIDDMLKLSRLARGNINLAEVDLSAMAQAVTTSLRQSFPDREVGVSIAPDIIAAGDAVLLRAVLENLFSNAWKFTANVPRASIGFEAEKRDGELVCHVHDNGAGFDMAYMKNLFVPFQRLHLASEFPGNGIGLATVKRIITRLGGRVWAEGAVNKGATFHFTLPCACVLNEASPAASQSVG